MNPQHFFARAIEPKLLEALQDTPIVLLAGPRQAGKTTLVKRVTQEKKLRFLTLDDELTRLSAKEDPEGLIRSLDYVVIDEIQRAPELLLAIKKSVDEDRRPGRFLLTSSANIMTLPTVADSLAGRIETLALLPLSQSELEGQKENWVDHLFLQQILKVSNLAIGESLIDRVLHGGFPEAVSRSQDHRRLAWFKQYLDSIIQRDVLDIAEIEKLDQLPRFLRGIAQTAGQICNYSQLGGQVGLDSKTVAKYIGVFEKMYLLRRVEVFSNNQLSRVTKTPKLQFIDSGLLSTLIGLNKQEILIDRSRFGNVLESFVYSEILKHITTSNEDYQVMFYRDVEKVEVDFVIENARSQVVGIEVKATATVKDTHLKGLKKLAAICGANFQMGVLLYDGSETLPLGDRIWAVPISSLWGEKTNLD
jgi:predicted AAA+ superfamily ATPase